MKTHSPHTQHNIEINRNDIAGLITALDRFLYRYVKECMQTAKEKHAHCPACAAAGTSKTAAWNFITYHLNNDKFHDGQVHYKKVLNRIYDERARVNTIAGDMYAKSFWHDDDCIEVVRK